MDRVAQGGTVTLTATYQTGAGDLVDPTLPRVDILDADGTAVIIDAVPSLVSLGNYSYVFVVPVDGVVGVWTAHWTGTIDGADAGGDDFFQVVTPGEIITSTYDWLSLAEAKRALNIPDATTTFDVELASYITAASQRLDELAGAAVVRTVTGEVHSGGRPLITLNYRPVMSISAINEYVSTTATVLTAETNAAKPAAGYLIDSRWGDIRRRASGGDSWFASGTDNVVVTYVAGRFASTAAVESKYKQAAAIFLSHLWRLEQGAGTVTFGAFTEQGGLPAGYGFAVPNRALELISADLAGPAIA